MRPYMLPGLLRAVFSGAAEGELAGGLPKAEAMSLGGVLRDAVACMALRRQSVISSASMLYNRLFTAWVCEPEALQGSKRAWSRIFHTNEENRISVQRLTFSPPHHTSCIFWPYVCV